MFALTIDQRSSRTRTDRVPELLEMLRPVETVLPFERTVGDEVQGLIAAPEAAIAAVEAAVRSSDWSIGLGIGAVEEPLPSSVRSARGPALIRAREAVDAAKKVTSVRLAVRGGSGGHPDDVQALLRLVATVWQRRTEAQWRVLDAVARSAGRAEAADELGITVQAVSKSLLASADDVVRDVYPLLARVLREADEGGER